MCEKRIGFLFDLDGVLIDSETEYTRIWSEIEQHFPTGIEGFAIKIKGQTLPEILNTHFDKEVHQKVIDMLNEKEQQMRYDWLPGAKELLDEIRRAGYEAVLVTSSNEIKMRHLREERPELESYFKDIVTADKISRSKPDPEGYLLGSKILGLPPENCIVFEDSAQGVKAGQRAGAYVVGLTTTLPESAIAEFSNKVIATLADVNLKMIENIIYMQKS